MELIVVPIEKPDDLNVDPGPGALRQDGRGPPRGARRVRAPSCASGWLSARPRASAWSAIRATTPSSRTLPSANALALGAGHCFVVFVREGYPVNVLNQLKQVAEVCTVYCATANQVEVVLAETDLGRGILGVIDGSPPLGVETDQDVAERKSLLRAIGYKL